MLYLAYIKFYYMDTTEILENTPLYLTRVFSRGTHANSRHFVIFVFYHNMASSRQFLDVCDADLARFSEEKENENTKKKTESDLTIFSGYLASINERRHIAMLPYGVAFNFYPYNKKNISRWLWKYDLFSRVKNNILLTRCTRS